MDFRRELESLLAQIPAGRIAWCGDVARALGDVRASAAVFRFLREHPDVAGGHRVVTQGGRAAVDGGARVLRREGWRDDARPFADFRGTEPLAALRAEQLRIAAKASRRNGFRMVRTVGGVDVAYANGRGFASLVVVDPDGSVEAEVLATREVDFPYIPTYLAYREFPLIEAAFRRLREPPTVLLVDGHGRLHPARCGLACMVGVQLDVPTIGVAKSPLVGVPERRPNAGEAVPVRYNGEILGYALRATASTKPLYVSTGHRVALATAVRIVRGLCRTGGPEPLRLADAHADNWKRRTKEKRKKF